MIRDRRQRERFLGTCGVLGVAVLGLGTVAASTAHFLWIGEIVANVRFVLGLGGVAALACCFIGRRQRAALLATPLCVLHLLPSLVLSVPSEAPDADGPELRVASMNLMYGEADAGRARAFVREYDADLLGIFELLDPWYGELELWSDEFPHQLVREGNPFGCALLSKLPIEDAEWIDPGEVTPPWASEPLDRPQAVLVTLRVGGERVRVVAAHPNRAGRTWRNRARNTLFLEIADALRGDGPAVLFGDLNATETSPGFQRLLRHARLEDSRNGFGRMPSWSHPELPGYWVPLDHVLVRGATVVERGLGPEIGSDHLPVTAVLRFTGDGVVARR